MTQADKKTKEKKTKQILSLEMNYKQALVLALASNPSMIGFTSDVQVIIDKADEIIKRMMLEKERS